MSTDSLSDEVRAQLKGHVVVCVAEDPDVLTVLRRCLGQLTCQTLATDNPEEALALISTNHVSLVLADQRLKAKSCQQFLKEVAERSPMTARVVLASYPETHDVIELEEETVHGLIGKPWDGPSLVRTIVVILRWQEERSRNGGSALVPALAPLTPARRIRSRGVRIPARVEDPGTEGNGRRRPADPGDSTLPFDGKRRLGP